MEGRVVLCFVCEAACATLISDDDHHCIPVPARFFFLTLAGIQCTIFKTLGQGYCSQVSLLKRTAR